MSDWWKKSVVYQIYPQSFNDSNNDGIGDIQGIIEKLPYLEELGVDVLWLNPIYVSPLVDNGYDIADYYKINPDYGTLDDFKELLEKAHEKKIRIIMDLVVNHTSDQNQWFLESKKGKDNKYSDFYIWRDPKADGSEPNNWGSTFGGSAWTYVPERKQYYLHLFAKEQPDLNWENEQVRQTVYEMMRYWLDLGIDGFRMDVISLISKRPGLPDAPKDLPYSKNYYFGASNGPRVHEFLQEMNQEVLSKYDCLTVGETANTTSDQAVLYTDQDRHELSMVFQFDHMHLDYGEHGKFSNVRFKLSDLRNVMTEWENKLENHGWNSLYWSNHDQPRATTRFGDDDIRKKTVALFSDLDAMKNPLDGETGIMSVLRKNGIIDAHAAQSARNTRTVKARGIELEGITGRMKESRKRLADLVSSLSAAEIEVDSSAFSEKLAETFSEPYAAGHAEKVDEIKVVPIDAVQCPHYRHAFVLGLDRNTLPGSIPEGRILTREEEEEVPFFHSMSIMDRYAYTDTLFLDACSSASDGIFLSYSRNTVLADQNEPSHYWLGFEAPVKEVGLSTTFNVPEFDIDAGIEQARRGKTPVVSLTPEQKEAWSHLQGLLSFENRPENLTPELAKRLYVKERREDGCHIAPSYSALDTYVENPYEFFLSRGLGLKKKEDYVLSPKNAGTYIHDLLEAFTNGDLNVPGSPVFNVGDAAADAIAHVARNLDENVSRNSEHEEDILSMLSATAQTRRFKARLEDTFRRYLVDLKNRQMENQSQAALGETGFNTKDSIRNVRDGLDIPFELDGNTYHLDLSGTIDCISVVNREGEDTTYLEITDYKTSNFSNLTTNLDIKLENGIKLQLVIYAMLIEAHMDEIRKMLEDRGFEVRDRIEIISSAYARVNDEKKGNSRKDDRYYEIGISDEGYSTKDKTEVTIPFKDVENLIVDAYRDILSGHLEISPYQLGSKNGLEYSDFKNIMCFDELFGNSYRELKSRNTDTKEN